MFHIKLLGGLSLDSATIQLPASALQRRRLTLLSLLALPGRRGMSRERLQLYLWPDGEADRARHAMDQLLYATRRDLGSDAVLSSIVNLRLNPAVFTADVWAFDDAIAAERWEKAASVYSGPILDGLHLVDGTAFEHWIDAERQRRAQEYHRALEALAKESRARGDLAGAVQWLRRRAAADPLSTAVALELMQALLASGDRTGALQHARIHQQLVRVTLGIEPHPTVEAFLSTIALSDPERGSLALSAVGAPAPAQRGSDLTASGPSAPNASGVSRGLGNERRSRRQLVAGSIAVVVLCAVAITLLVSQDARDAVRVSKLFPRVPNDGGSSVATASPDFVHGTRDAAARALYLRARTAWETRTEHGLEDAVVLYRQAIGRDPAYAAAYTGLAQSYAMLGYFGFAPGDAMFPKARGAAERALTLDASAGEAYSALGQSLAWQHEWARAEDAYLRAITLVPGDATTHQWYALLLAYIGRAHEAAAQTTIASRLDPLSVQIANMHGMMLYYDGDLKGALQQYERTVDVEPDTAWVRQNPWVLTNFGRVAAAAGQHRRAIELIESALRVVSGHPRPVLELAYVYVLAGELPHARAAFERADRLHGHYPVYRALMHGTLGELDEAFAWFERVSDWPLPALVQLSCDARYRALRADARYDRIRKRLRLPPALAHSPH